MNNKSPIAVVGMAGLFPGAPDLDIFWQNIINKVEATSEVPKDRWIVDPDLMYHPDPMPDKALSRRCCLIHDFHFDPKGIDIDKDLINELDPLYHVVLHTGRAAVSDCKASLNSRERTGVVLAAIALPTDSSSSITREIFGSSFEEKLFGNSTTNSLTRNQSLSSRVTSLPGALLAKGLGLGGGSYTIDAACASSLYAVKFACDELQSHRTDAMLAGGVSRPECLYTQVGFSQLRALSPSGRCAPFDESADGLVVGEGAGILVLKRLEDAINDGDNIYGLIRGIGLSNDMRGNLLAPDTKGQIRAMRKAYKSAGLTPYDMDLIECHGAGTPVGDTTELHSLRSLWGESGWSEQQCAIGSIKSMIGHLLTGAGAAGMIKTLLAFKHKMLPPSLNFKKPAKKSPLLNSPFRVQSVAREWKRRSADCPRRAAVSAFGFGGINGHLLFEEWNPETSIPDKSGSLLRFDQHTGKIKTEKHVPIAIVGMEAAFGSLNSLRDFQETVLNGESIIGKRPENRWKGCDDIASRHLVIEYLCGGFIDELLIDTSEFHIPPNEIRDILPQHLLMLKVAAGALTDAGLPLRNERPDMGVIVGLDFDFEATNFHQRWNLHNSVQTWGKRHHLELEENETNLWLKSLREESGPPLTHTRTLGALGGIVASRIAREFRFGGPSFVVSCGESSGLRALEIGVRLLQQNETDAVLVGAIDLFGDVRSVITSNKIIPFSRQGEIRPFDTSADGTLPGEGAAALVLKRLDSAIEDGDRIYSVIKGIGSASGGGIEESTPSKESYMLSLKRSFQDADITPSSISYIETHGSGEILQDTMESKALYEYFSGQPDTKKELCAVGSVKPNIGHTGAAAGLASFVKTSLCLYHEIIPPLTNFIKPANDVRHNEIFHIPAYPQFWLRDRQDGPRRACVASMTPDGICMHVVLEGFDYTSTDQLPDQLLKKVTKERKRPLGDRPYGLFAVEGDNKDSLLMGLNALDRHIINYRDILNPPFPGKEDFSGAYENIEHLARNWYLKNRLDPEKKHAVTIVANDISRLEKSVADAKKAVLSNTPIKVNGSGGVNYSSNPLGRLGETAFVFPGSGNHYVGMGRGIGVHWPDILREMDEKTLHLKTQLIPRCFIPQRASWEPGWEKDARENIISDPLNMIFGQVAHGGVVTNLIKSFGLKPSAIIGYSLGESAGLFAMGAWPDRGQMLKRMQSTDLFSTSLAGPCNAARKAWGLSPVEDVNWCVAVVNRSADNVRKVIRNWSTTRLLIINTPDECVIGGRELHVKAAIKMLGCDAFFLDGVVTVHCDAAAPVAEAYKALHIFPTTQIDGVRFYSCALGRSYDLSSESTASSILNQALSGFDFPAIIRQAYKDGIRIFLEMGPNSSCTRMINKILEDKPHLAVSACISGEDDYITILKMLGRLIAERVPVSYDNLYENNAYLPAYTVSSKNKPTDTITMIIGGKSPSPALPPLKIKDYKPETRNEKPETSNQKPVTSNQQRETRIQKPSSGIQYPDLIKSLTENIEATSKAHEKFLNFSSKLTKDYAKTFSIQTQLIETFIKEKDPELKDKNENTEYLNPEPAFSRDMCMEFAIGSIEKVLGPKFAVVDTYKARVRLPDEPLMLVDRIISVEGEKGSLGHGRVVTEHDVLSDAWYLDGGHAPVCISVEAGQADLFLCSYLGIDHVVKGERTYRLLDANVIFHTGLPQPGDTIRYEIEIEKFVRQGDTYLFFFSFEGSIGDTPLISMSNGCAGFFTEDEVINSGGIILTDEDTGPLKGNKFPDWKDLVELYPESYNDDSVEGLREGDLSKCFGSDFKGIDITESLRLPSGRMKLIDRILSLDPVGGRYGLGSIRAQADIHPDDWFLTCHFKDDMVMPGTLMYECCAHTLRIFIQRIGWVTDKPGVCYEPVTGIESVLKCRGPVTPKTSHVIYEVDIKELGYAPEPYVIADANMYADGHHIVMFKDMSMKMTGITRTEIESFWKEKSNLTSKIQQPATRNLQPETRNPQLATRNLKPALFDRSHIIEFATGSPSKAFGDKYKPFDSERFIARLPAPPYSFIDRITSIEQEQWSLKPEGWVEAEYDVNPEAWYFRANRTSSMPYCIINEIALQACGWLASYIGSALKSEKDLRFRNLGGNTTLYQNILPDENTLTTRTRLTQVSKAGDITIEQFDFQVFQSGLKIYEGDTSFGFFTKEALAIQTGIHGGTENAYVPVAAEIKNAESFNIKHEPPFDPDDKNPVNNKIDRAHSLSMPAKAVLMLDQIDMYIPDAGPYGLGFIRGIKKVDPDEWFFKAHFFQDPVCPGSLGIESFLQLIRFIAIDRFKHLENSHSFELLTKTPHNWIYRGQILPENKKIEVEAVVTKISDKPNPEIFANGYLKVDGLYIYKMDNFGFRLVPVK